MPLTAAECSAVANIKSWVREMLAERARLTGAAAASPSGYWSAFCDRFAYMLDLPEAHYGLLRLHTYHLDGDNYQSFYFGNAAHFRKIIGYDALIANTPPKYRLSAPGILGEYGFGLDGQIVSNTIFRMQRGVNTLYSEGVLPAMESSRERSCVLEIGGGYGCLAYQMNRILPNTTYLIVDLPETLLFSASYLSLGLPAKRIHLYRPGSESLSAAAAAQYDFVLVPNFALDHLKNLRFELALNIESFQEMTPAQLAGYLDFVRTHARLLYSMNQRVQDRNPEQLDVTAALQERFHAKRIPEPFRLPLRLLRAKAHVAHWLGLREPPPNRHEEYLCRPV